MSPSGDPIGGLIHTMTLIDSSSKLDDIARLFREVSKLLKDISTSKAALLLKPLQSKSIFPVITESKPAEFHALMGVQDSEWYIADQANLIESFTGVVPLLAFSIQDLPAVEDLFRVLKLEGRKMSKMVSSQTLALGQTKSDFRYSDTFRSKSPFIKASVEHLIPFALILLFPLRNCILIDVFFSTKLTWFIVSYRVITPTKPRSSTKSQSYACASPLLSPRLLNWN
jgi:hypothetical protein